MPKRILTDSKGVYDLAQVGAITRGVHHTTIALAVLHIHGQYLQTEIPLGDAVNAWTDYVMTNEARRRLPAPAATPDDSRESPPSQPVDAGAPPPAE